jgi:type II secretory pathway component PulJ
MANATKAPRGISLIEMLVVCTIFLLVLLGIYQLFDTGQATYASGTRRADVQQNARLAMDEMVRQMRMAGYPPENFDAATGNEIANPLAVHLATDRHLALFGALGGVNGAAASRVYLYCLIGDQLWSKEGPLGDARSYTCDTTSAVADGIFASMVAENVAELRFRYYDRTATQLVGTAAGNPAVPCLDAQPVNAVPSLAVGAARVQREGIRTVVLSLDFTEAVPRQAPQQYRLTSSVRLRNQNQDP